MSVFQSHSLERCLFYQLFQDIDQKWTWGGLCVPSSLWTAEVPVPHSSGSKEKNRGQEPGFLLPRRQELCTAIAWGPWSTPALQPHCLSSSSDPAQWPEQPWNSFQPQLGHSREKEPQSQLQSTYHGDPVMGAQGEANLNPPKVGRQTGKCVNCEPVFCGKCQVEEQQHVWVANGEVAFGMGPSTESSYL